MAKCLRLCVIDCNISYFKCLYTDYSNSYTMAHQFLMHTIAMGLEVSNKCSIVHNKAILTCINKRNALEQATQIYFH